MAEDQLKKRSNLSNVIHHNPWAVQKAKKKKVYHYDLDTKSTIALEWDNKKEHVVPKKEQIGIAYRELIQFLPFDAKNENILGDVFAAPPELFELNNLTGLLSYEVWQTHLSEQEREFLTQFLPEGADLHKIVHGLLAGNNFCFGNPFAKWGASVCSGDCHPDAVRRQEQCNKANKIAYYSELHEHHTKMIRSLQLWKEAWASCENEEDEFMQKILRSRKDVHRSGSSLENGARYGPQDDLGATSGSCSWDADDKLYSSDSPDLAMNGETLNRVSRMDPGNTYHDYSGGSRSVARPSKGDKSRKLSTECDDGAKYMSYIKVSKEQHERVKSSMKYSNTSVQPTSLNHVLGNLDSFCVQPYKVFEEEETQKLHEHWLLLAKKDLPLGFENWKNWQSAKWQLAKCIMKEMEDKRKSNDRSVLDLSSQNQDKESQVLLLHGPENATLDNTHLNPIEVEIEGNRGLTFRSELDLKVETHENALEVEHKDDGSQYSTQNQHLVQISMHNDSQNFSPMAMDANSNVLADSCAFPCSLAEYTRNTIHAEAPVAEQFPLASAATEIWPSASLPSSVYCHQPTPVSCGYTSVSEFLLGNGQSSFPHRPSEGKDSFFYPHANQDRNELLLHSLYKDPWSSHYIHEQKLSSGLGFHPAASDAMLAPSLFARNICSSLPLHQNIQEHIFTDGGARFSVPRQEQLLPLNHAQDWTENNAVSHPMPASSHNRLNQNWFSNEEVVRDRWTGGVQNQDIGNACQVADESLLSVLSHFNGQRSVASYGSPGFIQSGNNAGVGHGAIHPSTANGMLPRAARGLNLNYMSGNEVHSATRWVNLPGGLQETGEKSFPWLWNNKELG
uniref:uncharacterized protein LOC122578128 isoform X2 n=1 Tax=Erigeron canadensis TaxID=72917 RepID=UPI001CB9971E|nr:uncharacterized protein LOC122578128 isoform X2 [Erigeron canadensis]